MLVKAKWSVKDASGWHNAGEVFETASDLGDSVEVLIPGKPARHTPKVSEKETIPEPAENPAEKAEPAEKETPKPRANTRRKAGK